MSKPRDSIFSYADCRHISKFYIYNEISQAFGRLDVPLNVIFARAARAPAHNKAVTLSKEKMLISLEKGISGKDISYP